MNYPVKLSPKFSPNVTNYNALIPFSAESVDFTFGVVDREEAKITVNGTQAELEEYNPIIGVLEGTVELELDSSDTITVNVSNTEKEKTYTINFQRVRSTIEIWGYTDYNEMDDDPVKLNSGDTIDFGDNYEQPPVHSITFTIKNTGDFPLKLTGSPLVDIEVKY